MTPKQPKPRSSHKEEDKEDKEIARRHAVEKLKEEDKEDLLPKREAFASFREMNIFCAFSQSVLFSLAFVGFTTEGKDSILFFRSFKERLRVSRARGAHTHSREREEAHK